MSFGSTLCHVLVPYEPGTFSHCSCWTASTSQSHYDHQSPSSYRCDSKPSHELKLCEPTSNRKKTVNYMFIFIICFNELTCKIVSKLKVRPFHKVNSPELAPVINRRPSGVQANVKTGQRILLVAVFTNLVVIALLGLSK